MPILGTVAFSGKAKATRPGQSGTPSIASQASGQVGISWTAPTFSGGAPISDYKIEYSSNGGSSWTEWAHSPSTLTSATVTGLSNFLTYIFRVSAINAVGTGTTSGNSAGAAQFNAASGGSENTISNYNGTGQTWKVHTFTGNGTLTISRSITTYNALIVAGGGGGAIGVTDGGGGGAGGLISVTNQSISAGSYGITVGAGGNARDAAFGDSSPWYGKNSSFSSWTAIGGGPAGWGPHAAGSGGSGGGNTGGGGPTAGAAGTAGQGYAGAGGGAGYIGGYVAGGGGGAGGSGLWNTTWTQANGGPGVSNNITGSSYTYSAGGCGSYYPHGYG